MKRLILVACLLLAAAPAFADPVYLFRVPVKWRKAVALQVGALQDSNSFNQAGVAVADTTAPIDIRCLRPRLDVAATAASDSQLWARFVIYRNALSTHGGGWVNTPSAVLQLLTGPTTLGPAGIASSATVQRLSATPGSPDTTYSIQYSWATVQVGAPFVTPSWIRFIIPSVAEVGEFVGYVEFYTSCPSLTLTGQ